MLEKALSRGLTLLPTELKWKFFRLRGGIVFLSSTKPGELSSTPEMRRITSMLANFLAGSTQKLPKTTIVKEHILDGGWVHPIQRLNLLEEKQGLPIVGLEWMDENLQGRSVAWCGKEMRRKGVRVLFSLPSEG